MTTKGQPNNRLRGERRRRGWRQVDVVELMYKAAMDNNLPVPRGLDANYISRYERGVSEPSPHHVHLLCLAYELPTDRLGLPGDSVPNAATMAPGEKKTKRRALLGYGVAVAATVTEGSMGWLAGPDVLERLARLTGTNRIDPVSIRKVGRGDLEAVREMVSTFSRVDQRHGGGHARASAVEYLTTDVVEFLNGSYSDDQLRREMFSAASELAYLSGWMAFDNSEHDTAKHYFSMALNLAAEADDPPMAGHILRAMAHQALDLGHYRQALDLATASVDGQRYTLASPRERALLGVVYARSLVATGQEQSAAKALVLAEDDLSAAGPGRQEPSRVFFFGEASLAHETACALRDSGDLAGAVREFRRSVRTRKATTFTRTHAVTLGYMGAVQAREGNIDEAFVTWSRALDAMSGVRSGRTRRIAMDIRSSLSPLRRRGVQTATELDARALAYLIETDTPTTVKEEKQ